jgi:hypothetical protein
MSPTCTALQSAAMAENVVALKQRHERSPVVNGAEFRLDPETHALELTLFDDHGGVFILAFGLESKTHNFDLSLLAEARARRGGTSAAAS